MKVKLLYDSGDTLLIELSPEVIRDAAIMVYRNIYFTFSRLESGTIVFAQVPPPKVIE
jgi:hypothetical protein